MFVAAESRSILRSRCWKRPKQSRTGRSIEEIQEVMSGMADLASRERVYIITGNPELRRTRANESRPR